MQEQNKRINSVNQIKIIIKKVLNLLLIFSISVSILFLWLTPALGEFSFAIDIFSHFTLQITIVGILSTLLFAVINKRLVYLSILAVVILPILPRMPLNFASNKDYSNTHKDIYYVNMNYLNNKSDNILDQIQNIDPKIVVILELIPEVNEVLTKQYINNISYKESALSCGIYTNLDIISSSTINSEYPTCIMEFKDFTIITTHPLPPFNAIKWDKQKASFKDARNLFNEYYNDNKHPILIGDFNSSRYSSIYNNSFSDLNESKTYYTWNIHSLLSIPIDHALTKDLKLDISILETTSDHAALLIDIEK